SFARVAEDGPSVADVALLDELDELLGSPPARPTPRRDPFAVVDGVREVTTYADRMAAARAVAMERPEDYRDYAHVVVDESQDVSPMQWRMIGRRCQLASWGVVGDPGQAPCGPREWSTTGSSWSSRPPSPTRAAPGCGRSTSRCPGPRNASSRSAPTTPGCREVSAPDDARPGDRPVAVVADDQAVAVEVPGVVVVAGALRERHRRRDLRQQAAGGLHAPVVERRDPVRRRAKAAVAVHDLGPLLAPLDLGTRDDAVRVVDPEPAVLPGPGDRGDGRGVLGRLGHVAFERLVVRRDVGGHPQRVDHADGRQDRRAAAEQV